jgi:hypothetical protein
MSGITTLGESAPAAYLSLSLVFPLWLPVTVGSFLKRATIDGSRLNFEQ